MASVELTALIAFGSSRAADAHPSGGFKNDAKEARDSNARRPDEVGLERLGHFGLFHPRAPRALWEKAESWLRRLEAESLAGPNDSSITGA